MCLSTCEAVRTDADENILLCGWQTLCRLVRMKNPVVWITNMLLIRIAKHASASETSRKQSVWGTQDNILSQKKCQFSSLGFHVFSCFSTFQRVCKTVFAGILSTYRRELKALGLLQNKCCLTCSSTATVLDHRHVAWSYSQSTIGASFAFQLSWEANCSLRLKPQFACFF